MFAMSEKGASMFAALLEVQSELGNVKKTGLNGGTKSRYATLQDVMSLVRPSLNARGLLLLQYFTESGAAVATRVVHAASGEWVEVSVPVFMPRDPKNEMQALGGCMTYGLRYGLSALLGLAAVDDDDGEYVKQKNPATVAVDVGDEFRAQVKAMTVESARSLYAELKELGTEEARAKMRAIVELKA